MKAKEILAKLISYSANEANPTIDTFKIGDTEKEVKKAAFCFIATPKVIKEAAEWGADLLVTHEPTYHDHYDNIAPTDKIALAKKKMLEESGLTVCRFHDNAHRAEPDLIHYGFMEALGVGYNIPEKDLCVLENPASPLELARLIEKKCGIKHVRIVGNRDFKAKKLALYLGADGATSERPIVEGKAEIVIVGETCEWKCLEYVRDAAELGENCAVLVLGHVGSERDGMISLAERVKNDMNIETKYFECGEVYSYTEEL